MKKLLLMACALFSLGASAQHVEWNADQLPTQEAALATYQDYWGIGYMVPGLKLIENEMFNAEIEKPFVVGTNENVSAIPYKNFVYMGSSAGRDGVDASLFVEGLDASGLLRDESYANGDVTYAYNDAVITLSVPAAPEGAADGYGYGMVTLEYNRGANMNGFYVVDATGSRTVLLNRTRCEKTGVNVHRVLFGVEPGHTYYVLSSDRLSAHFYKVAFDACSSDQYEAYVATAENSDYFWSTDQLPAQADAVATYQDYWGIGYMVPGLTLIDNDRVKVQIEKPFVVGTNESASLGHTNFIYMGSSAGRDGVDASLFVEGIESSGLLRNESYANGDVTYDYNDAMVTITVPAAPEGSADGYGFGRITLNYNRGANMNAFYVVDATGSRTVLLNRTRCPKDAIKVHTAQFSVEPGHTYYVLCSDRLSAHLYSVSYTSSSSEKYYTQAGSAETVSGTATYAIQVDETHKSGDIVDVKAGDDAVATLQFGEAGDDYADFAAGKASGDIAEFVALTAGNGTNGNKAGGTFYTITPKYDGVVSVGVSLNADKAFHIAEDGVQKAVFDGNTVSSKYNGNIQFNVSAGKAYKVYCDGSKLGFFGLVYYYGADPIEEKSVADQVTAIAAPKAAVEDGIIYNLAGQRVKATQPGQLYIQNGKKFIAK